MIDALRKFFAANLNPDETEHGSLPVDKLQLAAAALLIEVMNSDNEQDEREMDELLVLLKKNLSLDQAKLAEVVTLARRKARDATSLYEFTQLINEHYDYEQKFGLIENMWRIAFSDSYIDKYEDHLIRKVAELIYLNHSDFIRSKLKVRDELGLT